MFAKLFGGGKKEEPKQQPVVENQNRLAPNQIKKEEALHQMTVTVERMEDKINQITDKTIKLENEMKLLASQGKKVQAKTKFQELSQLRKNLVLLEQKKQVYQKVKMDLEMVEDDEDQLQGLKNAKEQIKIGLQKQEEIGDVLEELQDMAQEQEQVNQQWARINEMSQNPEFDEEFENQWNQFESEAVSEKLNQVPIANGKITNPQIQQPVAQIQQKQPQTDVKSMFNAMME